MSQLAKLRPERAYVDAFGLSALRVGHDKRALKSILDFRVESKLQAKVRVVKVLRAQNTSIASASRLFGRRLCNPNPPNGSNNWSLTIVL